MHHECYAWSTISIFRSPAGQSANHVLTLVTLSWSEGNTIHMLYTYTYMHTHYHQPPSSIDLAR